MYNKEDLENIIQELFSDAADRGYTQEETEEMLDGINIDTLLQAIRHNAETVYAYRTDTKCEIGLNYRGEELFSQRATLLYEDIHDAVSDVAFVFRSTELWLLEDMRIAVVSCVSIVAGDDELVSEYQNLLARQFHADKPNAKWVTDISYIHTKEGVLYLSMIRDLYDNSIVAYKTASRQTVNLVLDTIRLAMKKEKKKVAAELQLHSDQGSQYTTHAYFKLTQSYGITPSMSSKGNPYDNAMAENFFSILKTECIYRHRPKTIQEANDLIDRYIHFYNHERIQNKTGVAPLTLRHSA